MPDCTQQLALDQSGPDSQNNKRISSYIYLCICRGMWERSAFLVNTTCNQNLEKHLESNAALVALCSRRFTIILACITLYSAVLDGVVWTLAKQAGTNSLTSPVQEGGVTVVMVIVLWSWWMLLYWANTIVSYHQYHGYCPLEWCCKFRIQKAITWSDHI